MKPAAFGYTRAATAAQAVAFLARDPDAKLLAGGQSLGPMLNLRLARPSTVVDVSGLDSLRYVLHDEHELRIGALTRHAQVEHYPGVLTGFEVVREACGQIGYPPIRENGTVGGSLAHADPTAEWSLVGVLLGAEVSLVGPTGDRELPVADFLQGPFMTSIDDAEMLVEVRFPRPFQHAAFRELARQDGDVALVAAAVAFDVDDGLVVSPRVAVAGLGGTPVRVPGAERLLGGRLVAEPALIDAGALDEALHAAATGTRDHHVFTLAAELVRRCLQAARPVGEGAR